MRKIIDIALKDLTRSMRSMFFLGISIAAPLLMSFIFSTAFGGGSDGQIKAFPLAYVNEDTAVDQEANLGGIVKDVFTDEGLSEIFILEEVESAEGALAGILDKKYTAALIIPEGFSAAVTEAGTTAAIRIISDPAASIAPQILENIVSSIVDGFSASKITVNLAVEELLSRGGQPDESFYTNLIQSISSQDSLIASDNMLEALAPSGEKNEVSGPMQIVGVIMVGMMIFFAFYTGAFSSESILQEEEQGTLARQFVSPNSVGTILGGKFLGVLITLVVQILFLVVSSSYIFGIDWGNPAKVAIAIVTLMVSSAGLGTFMMSLLHDTRQTGIVLGGGMTILGMAGGLFTTGIENSPAFLNAISRLTPHGWSLELWRLVLDDAPYADLVVPALVLLGMGVVLFLIAVMRFNKRFTKG